MQVDGLLALLQGGENDEGEDGGFFALLQAVQDEEGMAVLPEAIPDDIPIVYEIPADRVHVPRNQRLKETYDQMGQWINDVLASRRKEPTANDAESLRKQTQVTINIIVKLNAFVLRVINRIQTADQLAFEIPDFAVCASISLRQE